MPATITVEEAQVHLKELIGKLAPGEEVVITDGGIPGHCQAAPSEKTHGQTA